MLTMLTISFSKKKKDNKYMLAHLRVRRYKYMLTHPRVKRYKHMLMHLK